MSGDKLLKKAINKHNSGKLAEAKTLYKKILSDNPQHLDASYLLGTLLAEQGDLPAALKQLKAAESIAPQSHLVKNNLGNVYRLLGNFEAACQCYEQALSLNPAMPEACNNLAIVYRRLGRDELAIASYEKAVALKPDFVEAIYNLGKCYHDQGNLEDAQACYQRVIDINPHYAPAHHELGVCTMSEDIDDKGAAIKHLQRYLELAPDDPYGARMKLAYLSSGEVPEKHPAQLVQQTYEKKAASWERDVQAPDKQFLGPQHIEKYVTQYCGDKQELTILDIGCGTGLCGKFLRPLAAHLTGVDLSPHMLALAEQKQVYDELIASDIEDYLGKKADQYDLITASGVLIFFGDLNSVLNKIHSALKSQGLLIATLYRSETGDVSIRDNIHFAHSENHIRNVARRAGLELVSLDPIIHEYEKSQPQAGYLLVLRRT